MNLLPPQYKKEILQEENWQIILILGINILAVFICFSLILYATSIFISGETEARKIIYQQREREFETPQTQLLRKNLVSFNETLSKLDSFYQERFKSVEILQEISETVPSGIYLTNLSANLKVAGEKEVEYVLAGFAGRRDDLLLFKENLEKKEIFEEIDFPAACWLKSADINFTVNFKTKWK